MARPEVIANDSLKLRALQRNPFVHRGLEAALFSMLGRRLLGRRARRAFLDYGRGRLRRAATVRALVRGNPGRNVRFRHWRALSFVGAGQPDSAAVEIEELLAVLRAADEQYVAYPYESKAMYEYALGMLHEVARPSGAGAARVRAGAGRGPVDVPGPLALARLSLRERNAAEAAEHLAQAVEVAPSDGGDAAASTATRSSCPAASTRRSPRTSAPFTWSRTTRIRTCAWASRSRTPASRAEAEAAYRAYLRARPAPPGRPRSSTLPSA